MGLPLLSIMAGGNSAPVLPTLTYKGKDDGVLGLTDMTLSGNAASHLKDPGSEGGNVEVCGRCNMVAVIAYDNPHDQSPLILVGENNMTLAGYAIEHDGSNCNWSDQ